MLISTACDLIAFSRLPDSSRARTGRKATGAMRGRYRWRAPCGCIGTRTRILYHCSKVSDSKAQLLDTNQATALPTRPSLRFACPRMFRTGRQHALCSIVMDLHSFCLRTRMPTRPEYTARVSRAICPFPALFACFPRYLPDLTRDATVQVRLRACMPHFL